MAVQRRTTYKVSLFGGRVPLDLRFRGPLEAKSFVRGPKTDPPGSPGCASCGHVRRCMCSCGTPGIPGIRICRVLALPPLAYAVRQRRSTAAYLYGPKLYKFIGLGDIYGPKPYKFIGFGVPGYTRDPDMPCLGFAPSRVCSTSAPQYNGVPLWPQIL